VEASRVSFCASVKSEIVVVFPEVLNAPRWSTTRTGSALS
jgi:hypothetical protein